MELDYHLLISIVAIIISVISLSWNIYNKVNSERKNIFISSYKNSDSKGDYIVVMLTNTGKKPIYIRRIELFGKLNGDIKRLNIPYDTYNKRFENNPLDPENWETIIIRENKYLKFRNENNKYFDTKLVIVDPTGKEFKTKWFRQHIRE